MPLDVATVHLILARQFPALNGATIEYLGVGEDFHAFLADRGLVTDELVSQWRTEIDAELTEAVAAAERHPKPSAGQLFDYVYARPPERISRQRKELTRTAEGAR